MHFHLPEFIDPEKWPANSQYLNPVDFSVWGALQQMLYRQKFWDVDYLKSVLLNCWYRVSQDTVSGEAQRQTIC